MRIALIGTYPPPIGGTSIHIMRLREKLVHDGYSVMVYDTAGKGKADFKNFKSITHYKKWLLSYFFTMNEDIIHSHTHDWKERAVLSFGAFLHNRKAVFTFHSLRDELDIMSKVEHLCVKLTLKFADTLICTSKQVREKLLLWGCKEEKLVVVTPFICPIPSELKNTNDDGIEIFRKKHKLIISGNASNNNHYKGDDLYGLDMCLSLIRHLKEKGLNVGLIFAQAKITDREYFSEIKNLISDYDLEKDVLIITKQTSLIPILNVSDVFVRPTNTDTCGMSINESLMLGIPVIASDVCERAQGTITFESRNQSEFNQTVENCLVNLKNEKEKIKGITFQEGYQNIKRIYMD